MTTTLHDGRLRCKICEELIIAEILGGHSKLCRRLNASSKNVKQLNRLLIHYLEQECMDPRVVMCGKAAVDVLGTSLASPQKLDHIVSVLKSLDVENEEDDGNVNEQVLERDVVDTDVLQQLIDDKTKLVKELIKISFEMDSLSLTHATSTSSSSSSSSSSSYSSFSSSFLSTSTSSLKLPSTESHDTSHKAKATNSTTATISTTAASTTPSLNSPPIGLRRTYSTTHVTDLGIRNTATREPTRIADFQIIKPISKGAFGAVYLVRKKKTGDLFAVKVINKIEMMSTKPKQAETVIQTCVQTSLNTTSKPMVSRDAAREKSILSRLDNPFVVPLIYSFQSMSNLFLVMPFMPGGDLMSLLRQVGSLDISVVKQYSSEIVLAVKYLHEQHVVHRDLKPDNVLIGKDGHIQLTDFGLSEEGVLRRAKDGNGVAVGGRNSGDSSTWSGSGSGSSCSSGSRTGESFELFHVEEDVAIAIRGTPDYLAPELLLQTFRASGPAVDWWALGVMMYEMFHGDTPFKEPIATTNKIEEQNPSPKLTVQDVFANIRNFKTLRISKPTFVEELLLMSQDDSTTSANTGAEDAVDIISKLLQVDSKKRYGARLIMQHSFFQHLDWTSIREKAPPFVPTLTSEVSTEYFESRNLQDLSDLLKDEEVVLEEDEDESEERETKVKNKDGGDVNTTDLSNDINTDKRSSISLSMTTAPSVHSVTSSSLKIDKESKTLTGSLLKTDNLLKTNSLFMTQRGRDGIAELAMSTAPVGLFRNASDGVTGTTADQLRRLEKTATATESTSPRLHQRKSNPNLSLHKKKRTQSESFDFMNESQLAEMNRKQLLAYEQVVLLRGERRKSME